jgi:GxxExxY protein
VERQPPAETNAVATAVVDAAFKVHSALGPGLLESVYRLCLHEELSLRGYAARKEVPLPIRYGRLMLDGGFRIDLLVNDLVVVEVKAVERMLPVHDAQLLTYLKLAAKELGLLINFNVPLIKDGICRRVLSA